ncbi:MAG: hypothetical protein GY724_23490 [Actinomycetia bacterium]|nr:hypothetical protein [Actinomycetes bacterium]MCP4225389.1 hypothetical protein [Actinomycetes bacterium]
MNNLSNAARLGVTEQNLRIRRDFVGLGDSDRGVLTPLVPWIQSVSADLARRFYDHQFSFDATAKFFADRAQTKGISVSQLRSGLEQAQARYIEGVFSGARSGWDVAYFEQRLHVGVLHESINVPFKWYVGSYSQWRQLLTAELHTHFAGQAPASKAQQKSRSGRKSLTALEQVVEVMASVEKVFNIDLQAIGDAFFVATLESLGMDVGSIQVGSGQDRTESLAQVKEDMQTLNAQAETMASDVMDADVLDQVVKGSIGQGFSAVASKVRSVAESVAGVSDNIASVAASADQLGSSATEIAARTSEIAELSSDAVGVADTATTAVTELSRSSDQIDRVVNAIAVVAAQTNLLALNATIEAARAGEAGKGFSVVANEVKHLAGQTAEATVDIESQIREIRTEIANAVEAIDSMVDRVRSVNELQTAMASAVEEQSIAVGELGRNLDAASTATSEIRSQVRLSSIDDYDRQPALST